MRYSWWRSSTWRKERERMCACVIYNVYVCARVYKRQGMLSIIYVIYTIYYIYYILYIWIYTYIHILSFLFCLFFLFLFLFDEICICGYTYIMHVCVCGMQYILSISILLYILVYQCVLLLYAFSLPIFDCSSLSILH